MCTNCRKILNRYTMQELYVPCGQCPACKQSLAGARTRRIRNNLSGDMIYLFVTLTYDRFGCPYVYKEDFTSSSVVKLYRDSYLKHNGQRVYERKCLDENFEIGAYEPECRVQSLRNSPGKEKIGICYYKDVQDFIKRLRVNLQRNYNYEKSFSYYFCTEYGPTTHRPHAHGLLGIRASDEKIFRDACVESWPFADRYRTARNIEVARDASAYVSSYVNCSSDIPNVLSLPALKVRHSYSKGFGFAVGCFRLPEILRKVSSGSLTYSIRSVKQHEECTVTLPYPQYVINRYFPKFKGFSRLSHDERFGVLVCPERLSAFKSFLDYSVEDLHKNVVTLRNAFLRYCDIMHTEYGDEFKLSSKTLPVLKMSFANDYLQTWSARTNGLYKAQFMNGDLNDLEMLELFDNITDVMWGNIHSDYYDSLLYKNFRLGTTDSDYLHEPNNFHSRIEKTRYLTGQFNKFRKERKVFSTVMSVSDPDSGF